MPKPIAAPPPARVSLEGQFDLDGYLTPYSDIVALMVLEHQAHFSNLVTRATWETRLGEDDAHRRSGRRRWPITCCSSTRRRSPAAASRDRPASPRSSAPQGPKDAKGRSLRELDLKTRLQKYPLSYMIYSPAFQALPEAPKNLVMGKIDRVLSGEITGREVRAPDAGDPRGNSRNPASRP